jgi:hypothetical protein
MAYFQDAFHLAQRAMHSTLSVAAGHEVLLAHEDLLRRKLRDRQTAGTTAIAQAILELATRQAARYPYHPTVGDDLKTALELGR